MCKEDWTIIVLMWIILLVFIWVGLDHLQTKIDTNTSCVVLLENRINEKYSPRIQVNRATIYNTEGEIILGAGPTDPWQSLVGERSQ